jgi:hypothetical protein
MNKLHNTHNTEIGKYATVKGIMNGAGRDVAPDSVIVVYQHTAGWYCWRSPCEKVPEGCKEVARYVRAAYKIKPRWRKL